MAVSTWVMLMPLLILGAATAATLSSDGAVLCAGGGTGQTIAGVPLDPDQVGHAATITRVMAGRGLPAQEELDGARLITILKGLFQQRISVYTATVANDPAAATNAFLDRLNQVPGWQTKPVGFWAQAAQVSEFPQRYQTNAALAAHLVSQFWPS